MGMNRIEIKGNSMEMIRHPSPKLYLFPLYDSLFGAPLGYPLNQLILGLK